MAQNDPLNDVVADLQNLHLDQENMRHPQIRIRDAAHTVPAFDGRNISMYQYTKCCRNAKNMVAPNAEYGLVQIIKNKLYGQVSRVVLNGDYNTIDELIKVLNSRFAPLHSSIQLYGDMSRNSPTNKNVSRNGSSPECRAVQSNCGNKCYSDIFDRIETGGLCENANS